MHLTTKPAADIRIKIFRRFLALSRPIFLPKKQNLTHLTFHCAPVSLFSTTPSCVISLGFPVPTSPDLRKAAAPFRKLKVTLINIKKGLLVRLNSPRIVCRPPPTSKVNAAKMSTCAGDLAVNVRSGIDLSELRFGEKKCTIRKTSPHRIVDGDAA